MKTIGLYVNREKDPELKITSELVDCIRKYGGNIKISEDLARSLGIYETFPKEDEIFDNIDMVICLGGDGTFLKAARTIYGKDVPMLGVNLGNLGFLAEIDKNGIKDAVYKLFNEDFCIEERMLLEATIKNGNKVVKDFALNDFVISRGALSRILHVKTYINDIFVDSFPGDGLIVSTPTGSTAYSLSAGGPIVEPDVDLIILTPICPHILYSRPIITTADRVVRITVDENYNQSAMLTVDGQKGYKINAGNVIEIKSSCHRVKIVRLYSRNFFNVLRTKIYERGESLRQNEI